MIWENVSSDKEKQYNDTLQDTLLDMINYCVITLLVMDGQYDGNNKKGNK